MSDDLIDRLRALPPPLADVPDRTDLVRRRVLRRRRVVVGASASMAVLVTVGITFGLVATRGESRVIVDSGPAPILSCPKTFDVDKDKVPKAAHVDVKSRLVPKDQIPVTAVACSYGGDNLPTPKPWTLNGRHVLRGDLSQLVADLTWFPRKLKGQTRVCTLGAGPQTNYLLGLSYAGGGRLWVATQDEPNNCVDSTNGTFVSQEGFGRQMTASYKAGAWQGMAIPLPKPPPGAPHVQSVPPPTPCSTAQTGRWGQEKKMVPDEPVHLLICRDGPSSQRESVRVDSGFDDVIAALNKPHTKPFGGGCIGGDAASDALYELVFSYNDGPPVRVTVWPACHPSIENDSLQAQGADAVASLLQRYFR